MNREDLFIFFLISFFNEAISPEKTFSFCSLTPESYVRLNFNHCFLGASKQLGIGGLFKDNLGTVLKDYSKPVEAKILALLRVMCKPML